MLKYIAAYGLCPKNNLLMFPLKYIYIMHENVVLCSLEFYPVNKFSNICLNFEI